MLRSAVNKVMWVGRATVFLIGLAVILVLLFWAASVALWAGGKPSILDGSGQAIGITRLVESDDGAKRALAVEPLARRRPPPQGYAQVRPDGTFVRSKAVNGIQKRTASNSNPTGENSVYCFDLTFTPHVAVASPYQNNGAVVGTATPNDLSGTNCQAPYTDAAARTYAASPTADNDEIGFAIMFR